VDLVVMGMKVYYLEFLVNAIYHGSYGLSDIESVLLCNMK